MGPAVSGCLSGLAYLFAAVIESATPGPGPEAQEFRGWEARGEGKEQGRPNEGPRTAQGARVKDQEDPGPQTPGEEQQRSGGEGPRGGARGNSSRPSRPSVTSTSDNCCCHRFFLAAVLFY